MRLQELAPEGYRVLTRVTIHRVAKWRTTYMMKELHEDQNDHSKLVPKEGQRGSLCSNIGPSRCPSLCSGRHTLSDETVASLLELGEVLRTIHNRLISEGYTISGGQIRKPTTHHDEEHKQ